LLEAIAAIKGHDLIIIASLQAKDTIVIKANIYITKAKTRYKTKSSKHSPSKKKFKLN
jgi:hypothetical protein